jgi:hypothetical protein
MKNIRLHRALPIIIFLLTFFGCTTLEEDVLDELTGVGQAEVVSGSIAPVYGMLRQVWLHTNNFGLQEVASDEAILPYRGGTDWYDGGKFIAIHQHLMTPSNALVGDTWNAITICLSRAILAEERLKAEAENGNAAADALNEMIAMNAYLNMLALDNWGLVFKKERSDQVSEILRGQEAVDYLEGRLLSVVDVMGNTNGPGRFTKDAVSALLARLYLNAAVYRDPYGTPAFKKEDMDKVIQYTSSIISGTHTLSPEYFALFNDDNHTNTELIFALDQRGVLQTNTSGGLTGPYPVTRCQDQNSRTPGAPMPRQLLLILFRPGLMPTAV